MLGWIAGEVARGDAAMRERIAGLDGLRGVAALLVVAQHAPSVRLRWGWVAVDLFFVLSGYLITTNLLRGFRPGEFFARRALRLLPAYYATILGCLLLCPGDPRAVPYYLAYTQQTPLYRGGAMPGWLAMQHTWSLAIEEQFYLIWPFLMAAAGRRAPGVALAGLCGSVAARASGWHGWLLAARCDGLALGAILAFLSASPRWSRRVPALAWGSAGLAVATLARLSLGDRPLMAWRPHDWAEPLAASLASFAAVAWCLRADPAFLRWRPLVYLGTISYGIYLYHCPILIRGYSITMRLGIYGTPWADLLLAALSVAAAALSWHFVERPILRAGRRA